MSISHIANQLNSLQVSGQAVKPTTNPAVYSSLGQAMDQPIPTGTFTIIKRLYDGGQV